jgi:hypothetical protein
MNGRVSAFAETAARYTLDVAMGTRVRQYTVHSPQVKEPASPPPQSAHSRRGGTTRARRPPLDKLNPKEVSGTSFVLSNNNRDVSPEYSSVLPVERRAGKEDSAEFLEAARSRLLRGSHHHGAIISGGLPVRQPHRLQLPRIRPRRHGAAGEGGDDSAAARPSRAFRAEPFGPLVHPARRSRVD